MTGQPRKNPPVNTVFGGVCPDPALTMFFTVTYVPRQLKIVAPALINFGTVCSGFNADRIVRISNVEESPLVVNFLFMQGSSGFSLVSPPALPFTGPSLAGEKGSTLLPRLKPSPHGEESG